MPTFHYALEANAGVNLILGLLAGLFNVEFLRQIGQGWGRFSVGGVHLLRGPLARRRSLFALFQGIPAPSGGCTRPRRRRRPPRRERAKP